MIRLYLDRDFKITDRNNEIKGEKNKENKNTDELKPYCQPPNTKHSILHPGNAFFSLVKVIVSSLVYSSERTNVNNHRSQMTKAWQNTFFKYESLFY